MDHRLAVEWVPISRLHENPANPRRNDAAVPHVAASLRRFGWQQPVVARPSGEVIAGNTRLRAARELDMSEIPVAWFDGPDIEAVAFAIADNRTAEFAEWDDVALATLLEELRTENALDGVGYTEDEIDAILAEIETGTTGELDDPGPLEPAGAPVTQRGDLWLLGDHRLLCGDSTDATDVERLMAGEKAHLVATDPPYLVDYQGAKRASGELSRHPDHWDTYKGDEQGVAFFTDCLKLALAHAEKNAALYQWFATKRQPLVAKAWADAGLLCHQQVVWVKPSGVFGRSHFAWAHEPCLYGWALGCVPPKHRRPPIGTPTTWDVAQDTGREGWHETQKPLELFRRPIRYHTLKGEVCYEPFSGSGSQLIAAEELGRRCFAMELEPRYVDATLRRWERATGHTARLDGTGEALTDLARERGIADDVEAPA